jgi:hypothetical protein
MLLEFHGGSAAAQDKKKVLGLRPYLSLFIYYPELLADQARPCKEGGPAQKTRRPFRRRVACVIFGP